MASALPVVKIPLHRPSLEEVATVIQHGLKKNFKEVDVSVVECPDLSEKPFMLAATGICGSPRLADIGGEPNLFPLARREKIYDLEKVAGLVDLPDALVIGAGAGPAHKIGQNSEMTTNFKCFKTSTSVHQSCIHKMKNPVEYEKIALDHSECNILMNVFLSEGKPGKVIKVRVAHSREKDTNIVGCLREAIHEKYEDKPVGVGGCFVLEEGKAWIHVMPDYSSEPLRSPLQARNWMKFFEMSSPLCCVGYLLTHDPSPGYDLRKEHFHCFSDHGQGGHYHHNTSAEDAVYTGYFNIAEDVYRVDKPAVETPDMFDQKVK